MLGAVGYRDLLALEALKSPVVTSRIAIAQQFNISSEQMLAQAILQMIATQHVASTGSPWSLRDELKLWMMVTALPIKQRQALAQLLQHRENRLSNDQRTQYTGMVDQILQWMKLRLELEVAFQQLRKFLTTPPTITPPPPPPQVTSQIPPVPQIRAYTIPTPTAPPKNAGRMVPRSFYFRL
jgi:hypothetical protein